MINEKVHKILTSFWTREELAEIIKEIKREQVSDPKTQKLIERLTQSENYTTFNYTINDQLLFRNNKQNTSRLEDSGAH